MWEEFKREDGTPLRNFSSTEEMDEYMNKRWNAVVKPHDKVYHLGDVCMNSKNLHILCRLNGSKRLIRGNHDLAKISEYAMYFKNIYGVRVLNKDFMLTHVPVHPESVVRARVNVYGHIHEKVIKDNRYFNVSVENINYTPIAYEELLKRTGLS